MRTVNDDLLVFYVFDTPDAMRTVIERTGRAEIYLVTLDDNYEASVLLLDRYWNKRTFDVAGEIVVFVPARRAGHRIGGCRGTTGRG